MVKPLRGATRYSTGSRTINEALHRTNSSVRTYYPGRRSHKLVKTVCQNFEGTYLGTFPITTGRSSSDGGIWLQYLGVDTRSTGELGSATVTRENYQLG